MSNKSPLRLFVFLHNKFAFVNINLLQKQFETGRLQGAEVFAILFRLCDDEDTRVHSFKHEDMIMNDKGHVTLCQALDICFEDWNEFLKFIKSGMTSKIQTVIEVSNKFGGIPAVDLYFEKLQQHTIQMSRVRYENPMTPHDDIHNQYEWTSKLSHDPPNDEYECTVEINPNRTPSIMYYRRLKTIE